MLEVTNLGKEFATTNKVLKVLDDISFKVSKGESLSIVGPSGSGKTTLLGLCAGLDVPSVGAVSLNDIKLNALSEDDRAYIRNQYVGFVFQNFQLLPALTAVENITVPMELRGDKVSIEYATELLDRVGLADRALHYPTQLSGGEQQRIAIARAFITDPAVLFADEPTGNLDEETAEGITELLFKINKEQNTTLVMVTHNMLLANRTGRILKLKGGKLIEDKATAIV